MKAKTEKQLKLPKYFSSVIVMNYLGQVLLGIRKEDGIATPPGGHAQDHETPEQCAVRELFEETGLIANEHQLVTLPTIDTVNGKVCHCYMLITTQNDPTPRLDPDKEVSDWRWYNDHNLPVELEKDPRRFESVRNAFMRFHGITKGGEGSGVRGHTTAKQQLEIKGHGMKLVDLANKLVETNPFKEHLHKLENGAIFEGHELRSGKPLYLSVDQAMAHGYTPDDYKEAGSFHYEKAQNMSHQIEKIKALGKNPPPEMQKIVKFHEKQFKQNFNMAEKTHKRMADTEAAIADRKKEANKKAREAEAKKVKKSVVAMGQQDSAEVDTSKFSVENKISQETHWFHRINEAMLGFQYGDAPRSIMIDAGDLHLVKVDDGMYSGYVRLVTRLDATESMEDNAKVRIERMTVPALVQFLMAKEYIRPPMPPPPPPLSLPEPVINLTEKLQDSMTLEPFSESTSAIVDVAGEVKPTIDQRIRMLELIDKLLN